MATCKDCLHYDACARMLKDMGYTVDGFREDADKRCDTFDFKQQGGIAVALTPEEWRTVLHWLEYGKNYHAGKKWEWLANCKDKKEAAVQAARHEKGAVQCATLCEIIEAALYPAPPPKETE